MQISESIEGTPNRAELSKTAAEIAHVMRSIRAAHPWDRAADSEAGFFPIPVSVDGKPTDMPLSYLGTTGCTWAARGGCTFCDYGGYAGVVAPEVLVSQAKALLQGFQGHTAIQMSALGSFFDDVELPRDVRRQIVLAVRETPGIAMLSVEARAEHITDEKVREVVELLAPGCRLEIGLGLESSDDLVRNVCINKGISRAGLESAVRTIANAGAASLLHVFLKPPFLGEAEAIEDAVRTIEYAGSLDPVRIVLMVANVKEGTLLQVLHERGEYRPPWLWSVLEVARRISPELQSKLLIYGFRCGMPMLELGHNCPQCTDRVRSLIDRFDAERDPALLIQAMAIDCECKQKWHEELSRAPEESIIARVQSFCRTWTPSI